MSIKSFVAATATACAMLLGVSVADAAIIGVTANGQQIGAPGSVADDAPGVESSTKMLGFDERQGVLLGGALSVDGGSIAAGTRIDSHMILLNSPGNQLLDLSATWTFSGIILGVMSDNGGLLEAASNALLGAIGTAYPGAYNNRGFEGGNPDSYSGVGTNMLDVRMYVTEPGDWIRVITASPSDVPAPGGLAILGLGLVALGALRRRKIA